MRSAVALLGAAMIVVWADEGIVFTAGRVGDFASDLMLLRPTGTSPVSLFSDVRIQGFSVVRP